MQVTDSQSTYVIEGSQNPQIAPQKSGVDDPELARIISAWGKLPPHVKQSISVLIGGWR